MHRIGRKIAVALIGWSLIMAPLVVTVHELLRTIGYMPDFFGESLVKIALALLFVLTGIGLLIVAFRGTLS